MADTKVCRILVATCLYLAFSVDTAGASQGKDNLLLQLLQRVLDEDKVEAYKRQEVSGYHMPEEADPHTRTWMAFGVDPGVWPNDLLDDVMNNLCLVADTIAEYEPVSMLVGPLDMAEATARCGAKVNLIQRNINDFWMRDTGPVFVVNGEGDMKGVNFNFNGWGMKQAHGWDSQVAKFVTDLVLGPGRVMGTDLITEGGSIEVDGEGTAIITESCVLNNNRNPGWTKADVEAELAYTLGVYKVIWLPGLRGWDITDGHTDFYARFVRPGVVIAHEELNPNAVDYDVSLQQIEILRSATDNKGRSLEVHVIPGPRTVRPKHGIKYRDSFCKGYVNYYVSNNSVIAMEFGDTDGDKKASDTLTSLYPGRDVIMLNVDGIAAGGGGIHCVTQQQPAVQP